VFACELCVYLTNYYRNREEEE